MDLKDLKQSVSDMSNEELLDLLNDIRANRRKPAQKAPAKRKAQPAKKVEKALESLTADDIAKLIEALS
jgi:hypothetical protein